MEILGVTKTVVEFLRERIITGELPANKWLSESQLASQFGISRAPLREAFRILEEDKLIVSLPRRGCYVAELSAKDFIELYQAREMIEAYSVDLLKEIGLKKLPAVERDLKEIGNLRIFLENSNSKERLNYLFTFVRFHTALVESTSNRQLIHFFNKIVFHLARYQFIYAFMPGVILDSKKDHEQIYAYIQNGEWQRAKELLVNHIKSFGQLLTQKINDYPKTFETDLSETGT